MISRVSYIWLYVSDLERSIRFYSHALGLTLSGRWDEGATFDIANMILGLHLEEGKVFRGNSPVITFNVPGNIEQVYVDLKGRGVKFTQGIATEPYGKVVSFEDPDGHALLIHQPHETLST